MLKRWSGAILLFALFARTSDEVKKEAVHVGIDLGTTFSCVTTHLKGSNEFTHILFDNEYTMPSTVFVDYEKKNGLPFMHYGLKANAQNKKNPRSKNYFYGFKRVMGLPSNNPVIARFKRNVTYDVNHKGTANGAIPIFTAEHSDGTKSDYTPTELSALLLGRMYSEIVKDKEIISTVIATPAYFSPSQDSETRKAAELAGFANVMICKEPTAACIDYAQKNSIKLDKEEKVLVFDLGGGTFDISVVEVENSKEKESNNGIFSCLDVTKYAGDNFLGGENINSQITSHFMKSMDFELSKNEELRLRLFVEELKIDACNNQMTNPGYVATKKFFDGQNKEYEFSLDKKTFDQLAKPIYDKIHEIFYDSDIGLFRTTNVDGANKPISKSGIQKVILVGGSTRIPYIRQYLAEQFPNAKLCSDVDPDKSVSIGACRMAASEDGEQSVMVLNTTTLPIGIEVSDGSFQIILEKDKPIPTIVSSQFSTVENNQTRISLAVYTGVRPLAKQNTLLGTFELMLKDPRPRGVPKIEVKVSMSANYDFSVTATDLDTKVTSTKVFKENYIGTDKAKVQEILNAAKENEAADLETKNKLEQTRLFKSALEMYEELLQKATNLPEDDLLMFKSVYETYNSWAKDISDTTLASEITSELEAFKKEAEKLALAVQSAAPLKEKEAEKEAREAL